MNTAPQVKTTSLVDAINNLEFDIKRNGELQATEITNIHNADADATNREIDRINMCSLLRRISEINDTNINTLTNALDNATPGTTKLTDIATTELNFCHEMLTPDNLQTANRGVVHVPETDQERDNYISPVHGESISYNLHNINTEVNTQNKLISIDKIIRKYHSISNQPDSILKLQQLRKIKAAIDNAIATLGHSRSKFDKNIVIKRQESPITDAEKQAKREQIEKTIACIAKINSLNPEQLLKVANLPSGFIDNDKRAQANLIFNVGPHAVDLNTDTCISKKDEETLSNYAIKKLSELNSQQLADLAITQFKTLTQLDLINKEILGDQIQCLQKTVTQFNARTTIEEIQTNYSDNIKTQTTQLTARKDDVRFQKLLKKESSGKLTAEIEQRGLKKLKEQIKYLEENLKALSSSYKICCTILDKARANPPTITAADLIQLNLEINHNMSLESVKDRRHIRIEEKSTATISKLRINKDFIRNEFGFEPGAGKSATNTVAGIAFQNKIDSTSDSFSRQNRITVKLKEDGSSECAFGNNPTEEDKEAAALLEAYHCWERYDRVSNEDINVIGQDVDQAERIYAALLLTKPEWIDSKKIKLSVIGAKESPRNISSIHQTMNFSISYPRMVTEKISKPNRQQYRIQKLKDNITKMREELQSIAPEVINEHQASMRKP